MRDHMTDSTVFLVLNAWLPFDPPMTLCAEIAERWNRNPANIIAVDNSGWVIAVDVKDPDRRMPMLDASGLWTLAGEHGWRDGIWPKPLVDALTAAASRYGIIGVS